MDLENLIKSAAAAAEVPKRVYKRKKRKGKVYPKSVCRECYKLIREIKALCRQISKPGSPRSLRLVYYVKRKRLKRLIKLNERQARQTLLKQLEHLHENNPVAYWKTLRELEELTKPPSSNDPSSNINSSEWEQYFMDLMNKTEVRERNENLMQTLENMKSMKTFCDLDYRISDSEIIQVIRKAQNNKSAGPDSLIYEFIKTGQSALIMPMGTIFNRVFSSGFFPGSWSISLIKPLYKGSGSITDPSKYRGISLMSCMGKLFCAILNNRLVKHLESSGDLSKLQIAFRKTYRTTDHIFVLQTLIHKYIHKFKPVGNSSRYLYTAFVDFKKAYDSVWREALFYKLVSSGINGPFFDIVENMYKNYRIQVKLEDGLTEKIQTNLGVKQGCILSPTLFNFYINDLPQIFNDPECKPITLFAEKISCLMYADDLIIMSTDKNGLQKCLNKLKEYCTTWKLEVNTEKTKIMIFNKNGKTLSNQVLFYDGTQLEVVTEYKHLGVIFDICGSGHRPAHYLKDKAAKAMYKILRTFGGRLGDCKIGLHLFNHMVKPILLYSDSVWGAHINNFAELLKENTAHF